MKGHIIKSICNWLTSFICSWLIIGCISSTNDGNPSIQHSIDTLNNVTKEFPKRIYVSDSSYLYYGFGTILKHGYRLEYRVFVESDLPYDTLQGIFLMRGNKEISDLDGASSYGLPTKNIGYIGADFDSLFILVHSFGSGNPHQMQLREKSTGNILREGTWVDVDEDAQIILYVVHEQEPDEHLVIFDLSGNHEIISTDFNDVECIKHAIGGLRNCVQIDTVTTNHIVLISEYDDEIVRKMYKR